MTEKPKCIDCEVVLTPENAYRKRGSKTGFQTRCKKCQIEYQTKMREKRKEQKGHSSLEAKLCGEDLSMKLVYNRTRQLVDIYAPVKAKESCLFWCEAFDRKWSIVTEGTHNIHYRVIHVSQLLWDEVTADLQTKESVEEEQNKVKQIEEEQDALQSGKLTRRRRRR